MPAASSRTGRFPAFLRVSTSRPAALWELRGARGPEKPRVNNTAARHPALLFISGARALSRNPVKNTVGRESPVTRLPRVTSPQRERRARASDGSEELQLLRQWLKPTSLGLIRDLL